MTAEVSNPPKAGEAILALRGLKCALAFSNRSVGAALGIKGSDLVVLDALSQAGPQTPTELAHRTHTHVATMTGILTRLERDGWIERRHDDTDRRSMQIHATGAQRLVNTYARANKDLTRLLESWDPVQLTALVHFLTEASSIVAAFTEFTELTELTDKIAHPSPESESQE